MKKEEKVKVKGFTLIELVVTVGIIAVLSAILVSTVSAFLEDACNVVDAADAKNIYTLLQVKVLTSDNFMIDSSSPHTNKWNQSSNPNHGYVFVGPNSIKVSSMEVGNALAEAGYVDAGSVREYKTGSMIGYEYQYWSNETTIKNSQNSGYWGKRDETVKKAAGTHCRSQKT